MPYGTEALHILRAEKGFIMIGDETDGTVIPQDLGLNWALSKKKEDYLGQARPGARPHGTPNTLAVGRAWKPWTDRCCRMGPMLSGEGTNANRRNAL